MLSKDILTTPAPILIAVSGGSDSMALLNLLAAKNPNSQLHVATVDHQLRPEAASEAEHVAEYATSLNLPHITLHWENNGQSSSKAAREGRYELLITHAKTIGASAIALGHTMDDQAETILMRARRAKPNSGTRGLSGMSPHSTYEGIRLLRPLLNTSREALRDHLRTQNIGWINDPSNEKLTSERVRIRKSLAQNPNLPTSKAISRFAALSSHHRQWLNQQAASLLNEHVTRQETGLVLSAPAIIPTVLLTELFSTLILVSGGQPYRPSQEKLESLITAYQTGRSTRKAVGRSLIKVKKSTASFTREARNLPPQPKPSDKPIPYDNRHLILPGGKKLPFITALERFRPSSDDCTYKAVMNILSAPFCST
ncbi:MAG: tRNA lysidine(34) synthetase TilS [Rhizobiaceae bacterium]